MSSVENLELLCVFVSKFPLIDNNLFQKVVVFSYHPSSYFDEGSSGSSPFHDCFVVRSEHSGYWNKSAGFCVLELECLGAGGDEGCISDCMAVSSSHLM